MTSSIRFARSHIGRDRWTYLLAVNIHKSVGYLEFAMCSGRVIILGGYLLDCP